MKSKWLLVSMLSILALLTLGCGVCSFVTQKGKEVALTKVVEEVEKQIEVAQTPKADDGNGGGAAGGDTLGALNTLKSYRYKLSLEQTEGDQTTKMVGNGAYVQDPSARETYIEMTEAGSTEIWHIIQVGNKSYIYDQEEDGWYAYGFEGETEEMLDPNTMIEEEYIDVFKLEKKSDKVNDQDCYVYKADAKDLPGSMMGQDMEITGGTVRVWVSKKLNVMIRMETDVSGKSSDGTPATLKMTMDILDANTAIKIEPPAEDDILDDMSFDQEPDVPPTVEGDSDGIAQTLPKPDDASPLTGTSLATAQAMADSGDYDLYQTELSINEAVAFFDEAYPDAGWTKDTTFSITTEDLAMLMFKSDGRTATVIINKMIAPGTSTVIVYVN